MHRPLVTISYAQTLDGRLATRAGSSRWISGQESLTFSHRLRASHDAILVGVGTVLRDNPRLTVRLATGPDPLRVIADSTLRTPCSAAVLAGRAASGTCLAVTGLAPLDRRQAAADLGAQVLVCPSDPAGGLDLAALLALLGERGIRSVMVEGGARLITSMLRAGLADRLAVTIAPKILGTGIDAVGDLGIRDLADSIELADVEIERYGADMVVSGLIRYARVLV